MHAASSSRRDGVRRSRLGSGPMRGKYCSDSSCDPGVLKQDQDTAESNAQSRNPNGAECAYAAGICSPHSSQRVLWETGQAEVKVERRSAGGGFGLWFWVDNGALAGGSPQQLGLNWEAGGVNGPLGRLGIGNYLISIVT